MVLISYKRFHLLGHSNRHQVINESRFDVVLNDTYKNMFMLFWPWFFDSKRTDGIIESLNTLKPGFFMVVTVANLSKWPM